MILAKTNDFQLCQFPYADYNVASDRSVLEHRRRLRDKKRLLVTVRTALLSDSTSHTLWHEHFSVFCILYPIKLQDP